MKLPGLYDTNKFYMYNQLSDTPQISFSIFSNFYPLDSFVWIDRLENVLIKKKNVLKQGWNYHWTKGAMAPQIFLKYYFIYMCVLILAILLFKITFCFP